jgi:acetoin utilization protein AcuC
MDESRDRPEANAYTTVASGSPRGEPIVVFGDASLAYDFGPGHPLTPRRFGPGIDLLRAVGARRFIEPGPVDDRALRRVHEQTYIDAVRRVSLGPAAVPGFGIDPWGDVPAFPGMHDAAATVAGGSLAAMDRILDGTAIRAFHPGGWLHHAMPARAGGFCVYNDVALAIARARDSGERVLYVDIDVHHGDGVQTIFWNDRAVLTVSFHETGRTLYPGTGDVGEVGGPGAIGYAVNVPLEPRTGDPSWLAAIRAVVPALAAAFRPTLLVTQQGSDTHALDPLAHLSVTTAAHAEAARLLDTVATTCTEGRWLATGGGGYEISRVVPRAWGIVWLVQARRRFPILLPAAWRQGWPAGGLNAGDGPLPETLIDDPAQFGSEPEEVAARNARTAERALAFALRHIR